MQRMSIFFSSVVLFFFSQSAPLDAGNFATPVGNWWAYTDKNQTAQTNVGAGIYTVVSRSVSAQDGDVFVIKAQLTVSADINGGDNIYPFYGHVTCDGVRVSPKKSKTVNNYDNHHGPLVIDGYCEASETGSLEIALIADLRGPHMTIQAGRLSKLHIEHYRSSSNRGVVNVVKRVGPDQTYPFGYDRGQPGGYVYNQHLGLTIPNLRDSDMVYVNAVATAQYDSNPPPGPAGTPPTGSDAIDMFAFRLMIDDREQDSIIGSDFAADTAENPDSRLYSFSQNLVHYLELPNGNPAIPVDFLTDVYAGDPNTGLYNIGIRSKLDALVFGSQEPDYGHTIGVLRLSGVHTVYPAQNIVLDRANNFELASTTLTSTGASVARHVSHLQVYASSVDTVGSTNCYLWSELYDSGGGMIEKSILVNRYLGDHTALPLRIESFFELPESGQYTIRDKIRCYGSGANTITAYKSGTWSFTDHFN